MRPIVWIFNSLQSISSKKLIFFIKHSLYQAAILDSKDLKLEKSFARQLLLQVRVVASSFFKVSNTKILLVGQVVHFLRLKELHSIYLAYKNIHQKNENVAEFKRKIKAFATLISANL